MRRKNNRKRCLNGCFTRKLAEGLRSLEHSLLAMQNALSCWWLHLLSSTTTNISLRYVEHAPLYLKHSPQQSTAENVPAAQMDQKVIPNAGQNASLCNMANCIYATIYAAPLLSQSVLALDLTS